MLLVLFRKIFAWIEKTMDKKRKESESDAPNALTVVPLSPQKILASIKREVWKPAYKEAEMALKFFASHGLDMPCGIRLKDGRIVLPLYDINLKIRCEVSISDEGQPVGVKLQIGDHFVIGSDEPTIVVPDIISACILFQELGVTSATYISKKNIPAMVKLFPDAKIVTAGDGVKIAMECRASVVDLMEDGQPVSVYERFIRGDNLADLLGVKEGIVIKPLWLALRSFKACEWLLKGYIATGPSLCLIFAPSGMGKTFIVIDLFLTFAYGLLSWHGIECRKARCLYMCAEGYSAVLPRIKCWLEQHNVTVSYNDNFYIENGTITLDDPASVDKLQKVLDHRFGTKKPDIIAVDTMNLFMKGDENATQSATAFVQALKSISAENNSTILLVHHTGISDEKRGRGSSVFKGSLDTELRLARADDPEILLFDQTKNRLGRLMDEPIAFKLEEHETSFEFESGDKVTSCVLKKVDNVSAVKKTTQDALDLEVLKIAFKIVYKECPNQLVITKEQLKDFATEQWKDKGSAEISRQINPKQETRWLGRLIKAGILESDGAGTSFKVVKASAIDAIQNSFTKEEAPS
ncbi:MAG: AAA family ATPase [Eubacteriaceae bacterium]|nr:AAA family ATPase [Eubacteriaceae bacterium]